MAATLARLTQPSRRWLAGLSTARKLALAFGWVLLLTAGLGVAALFSLHRVHDASGELADRWLPGAGHLAAARASLLEYRELEFKHATAADAGYMDEYREKMAPALKAAQDALAAQAPLASGEEQQALRQSLDKTLKAYLDTAGKVVGLGKAGKQEDAKDVSEGAGKSNFDDMVAALDRLSVAGFAAGAVAGQQAELVFQRARVLAAALLAVSLLSGLGLAVLLARDLVGALGGEPRDAARQLRAIAEGDLTQPVRVRPGDEASLMAGLARMQARLADVVAQVREGAEGVATASQEIASGNSDLSMRTETQASALQRTAGAMAGLKEQALLSADNARDASHVATQASTVAAQGGQAVGSVVDTMRGISQSSGRIAEITGVIDSIAFQTNILALNAAVEAARAGEQGRGFAVVAGEVRSLAQRSATAAKEIKQLITASAEQIQKGSTQVDQAGATMQQVVQAIQKVDRIVTEISAAGAQQAGQVNDIGQAVGEMDQGTQQNAALVEQSAAAAESLRNQAQALVEAVAFFKLGR